MTNHIRRTRAKPVPKSYRKGETLTVTITAEVWDGLVTEADLELWLRHAIERYHTFRAGHIGFGFLVGGIKVPEVNKQS